VALPLLLPLLEVLPLPPVHHPRLPRLHRPRYRLRPPRQPEVG